MKKRYTKKQILESIKYWEKMLEEEIESPTEKIIQALAVGKLNDEAFGSVGIYNDNGIFWDMPNSQSNKFVIIVSNIDRFNDRYICDVMGGPDNKQFQDFGTQDFSIENMPTQYDFNDIVHNASSKYGVKLGSMNGFRNALDAHNNIESSYEIRENKMKKRYTRKQIVESIKYWQKQLRAGNYKKLNESTKPLKKYSWYLDEFIDYSDDESMDEFASIDLVKKNLPKYIPSVTIYEAPGNSIQSGGILMTSDNLDDLKKAVIYISYSNGIDEYDELVKSGRLDDDLKSMDFFNNIAVDWNQDKWVMSNLR